MKNYRGLRNVTGLLLVSIFLVFHIKGSGQTIVSGVDKLDPQISAKLDSLSISVKVGDTLQSTGIEQVLSSLGNIGLVAPDVLCIEINDCRILPSIQIPYQADTGDVIVTGDTTRLGEIRNMYVIRNGFPLGTLVGKDRKTIALFERIVGKHIDTAVADKKSSYTISSIGDIKYSAPVNPVTVWRKSKPTDWTNASWLLPSVKDKSFLYTARHYLYLKLPYPLKKGQAYLINMPELNLKRTAVHYVHDPLNIRSDAVHVSQIGFRADDPDKNGYLSVWMGNGGGYSYPENIEFSLVDDKTNQRVFTGKGVLHWKATQTEGIGTPVNHINADLIRLDFSSFSTPGRYRVCVEGIGCGYPFNIGAENTWKHAFKISMKGLFSQRSGIPMLPPYTDFVRPRSFHPADGVKVYQSTFSMLNSGNGLNAQGTDKDNFGNLVAGKTNEVVPEAWGGTMDAGDWDRKIQHLAAPRLFLELMEINPGYFKNVCLYIPESGNDLPDLVDEAIYGLDIYRRLQMPGGGIRGGVESSEHPNEGFASWQENLTVMVYAPDHWSSYIYAGVAARCAFVLKMSGKVDKAKKWEESAVKAMNWAEVEYGKWMNDPGYANISNHAKNTVAVERNLAAVELYRLTMDKRWHNVFLSTQKDLRSEAAFIYARLDQSLVDKKIQQNAIDSIMAEADRLVKLSDNNAFGLTAARPGRALGFGAYTVPAPEVLARAHYLSGDNQYLKTIIRSSQYSAGANPMNLCLTSGLGENCVQHVLHEDSRHTGQPAPIGLTVFGPTEMQIVGARDIIDKQCTPEILKWPSAEGYFDVFWVLQQNEYVIHRPLGQTAYIWGYLASRKNDSLIGK